MLTGMENTIAYNGDQDIKGVTLTDIQLCLILPIESVRHNSRNVASYT